MKRFEIDDSEDHVTELAVRRTTLSEIPVGSVLLVVRGMILARKVPVAVTSVPVTINQDMKAIVPCDGVSGRFLAYSLEAAQGVLSSLIGEAGHGTKRLPTPLWRDLEVWMPERRVQDAIVRFLEEKERDIERYLATKRRMIEELSRAADYVVTQTILERVGLVEGQDDRLTRGWSRIRLKFLVSRLEQGWSPQCDAQPPREDQWGVVKVGCVNGDEFDPSEAKTLPDDLAPIPELEIRPGDLLMSRANTRELLGRAVLVKETRPRLLLCDKIFRFRADTTRVVPEYLVLFLRSAFGRRHIEPRSTGASSSMQNISQEVPRDVPVLLPPYEEQERLVRMLRERIEDLRQAVRLLEREIATMQEYRTRLIADAVTGQIDVLRLG